MYILSAKQTGPDASAWKLWITYDKEQLTRQMTDEEIKEAEQWYLIAMIDDTDVYTNTERNYHSVPRASEKYVTDLYNNNPETMWDIAHAALLSLNTRGHGLVVPDSDTISSQWCSSYVNLCDLFGITFVMHKALDCPKQGQTRSIRNTVPPVNMDTPISGVVYKVIINGPDETKPRKLVCIGSNSTNSIGLSWLDENGDIYYSNHYGSFQANNGIPLIKIFDATSNKLEIVPTQYGQSTHIGQIREIVPLWYVGFTIQPDVLSTLERLQAETLAQIIFWTGGTWKSYAGPIKVIDVAPFAVRCSYNNEYIPANNNSGVYSKYVVTQLFNDTHFGPFIVPIANVAYCKIIKQSFTYHNTEIEL